MNFFILNRIVCIVQQPNSLNKTTVSQADLRPFYPNTAGCLRPKFLWDIYHNNSL